MGTWSTNLFGNDTSCDVRDTYIQHLQNQLSDEEAEAKMMEEYERDFARDEDEQPLFWYALAATEWKVGRLSEKVKAEALSWIDRQGGVDLWDAENLLRALRRRLRRGLLWLSPSPGRSCFCWHIGSSCVPDFGYEKRAFQTAILRIETPFSSLGSCAQPVFIFENNACASGGKCHIIAVSVGPVVLVWG